jgi:uncharacterized protein (TIGR03435 family)
MTLEENMRSAAGLILMLAAFGAALGQTAPPPGPAFEAASIRVRQGAPQWKFEISGTRLTIESYTLFGLVREAYDLQNFQVQMTGAPALMQSNDILYDIAAKAEGEGTPTRDQFRQMLQALLADRFRLKVRRELVEMPVYALIVGKGGPKFKPSSPDADPTVRVSPNCSSNYVVTMPKGTMEELARHLGGGLDRPAVDQSGLTGTFDIKLIYTPEFRRSSRPEPDLSDISIFTAVQDQLGLKLEPRKAMMGILVVAHVEKPSEN